MPRTPPQKRRLAPSSAESAPTVEIGTQSFGRRLQQLLDQKGMNYSDLARKVWGKTKTKSGYEVAKNRDRISVYVSGKAIPDARNLKKIADVLGVEVAELAPERVGDPFERQNPDVSLTSVAGGKAFLRINKIVPMSLAVKIVAMIDNPDDHDAPYDPTKPPKIVHTHHHAMAD